MRALISIALIGAMAAPVTAGQASSRSWSDLSQEVKPRWTVRMTLPDSTVVEGRQATFDSATLNMQIAKTSSAKLHPKGPIAIPRDQVKALDIRKNGSKGRWIGALVPVVIGVGAGGAEASKGDFLSAQAGAALFLIVAVVGGTAGYFIGRSVDRRFQHVTVKP